METTAFTNDEIQQFRAATRGTAGRIHFNNAGGALPPDAVIDPVIAYLQEEAYIGAYEAEYKYGDQLEQVYALIAKLINADVSEVAVVENASTAWMTAFRGISFKPGDEVLVSELEYSTNLIGALQAKKIHGIVIKTAPHDEDGNFSLPALEAAITPRTRMIAVTHIASGTGGMLPVAEIGEVAAKHNILYLVDACQSAGHVPLDVKAIHCDMLAATGRKYLRAPRGTGFLYVKKEILNQLEPLMMDGHSTVAISPDSYTMRDDARRFELYEKNRALVIGLGKAIEYALHVDVARIWQRIQLLSAQLREKLGTIPGVTIQDRGLLRSGIVTFSIKGIDSGSVKSRLLEKHINVSMAMPRATVIYMNKHHITDVVRASVHYYNTEEEISILCAAVAAISQEYNG
ncbi:MAG TPA: aminotransferase class V-fold PLP-dependent enzyme [Chitinophaga sp.]|uniref:aminotransferase class V-fold PLP-dependent enzyme n=1 Tax=Chitinophaga sp. TaxID=1869181 RepID=UPI002CB64C75|nr:aminotransferase class V-fold PLP-dependent enzyme [Chitinophaga sp.]HVI44170.1 aminotransferase class V-fold PLP-dependent enzyme [Chitinophaga sp.]